MEENTQDALIVVGCIVLVALFVMLAMWSHIVHAKVDVATGIYTTTKDVKGFYHLRGFVKNTTHNETDTDISVEMTFTSGHFYSFIIGYLNSPTKVILAPQQTLYWDHSVSAVKVPFANQHYRMLVRYNEFPYPPLDKQTVATTTKEKPELGPLAALLG